ncbi:dTMP kinase [Pandoraea apista]|uniref:Thymidylate kinase n=1 Tax=Pandoraea apista TaxID=93218 RepID=A0A0B5FMJ2_9BURK|nr:dTMP kinase [Pandoraea apista]AJF01233.2 thymidylate kinase [Pandoraea apista]AKH74268.1 thymidylate kinase [Pandoraea apista]AKI62817.1 thymidylate kinase [Pandoraea apista]ALS64503.1 dTMP kinase [Pandoraea apista]AVF41091.1 dTMP kinase [Pandoraea apista]
MTQSSVAPAAVPGKFVTFEGIDGAGKSTHVNAFVDTLRQGLASVGRTVVATREPGGTPLGEALRKLVLDEPMDIETEALLMFAGRREHLVKVIEPALARGDWVVSDRFTDATFAYQGGGRGLSLDKLTTLERWVQGTRQPDLTILFDLDPAIAAARLAGARTPDKFERESAAFFTRVREEYLRRAEASGGRFVVIDAAQSIEAIAGQLAGVFARLGLPGH